jgi:hypothetical protein
MTKRGQSHSINVDEIPAGWGIDGLIAERFLGFVKGNPMPAVPYRFWWHAPDGKVLAELPKLSEDLNKAMYVVEALFKIGWKFGVTQNSDKEVVAMFVPASEGYDPNHAVKARVVSVHLLALAICRAALLVADPLHREEMIELPEM